MSGNYIPKTLLGKWAVGLGIFLVVLVVLELIFAVAIKGDPAVIEGNFLLKILAAVLSVALTLIAPTSLIIGIISIVKYKQWLVLKFLALLYIFSLLLFLLGEFSFPH